MDNFDPLRVGTADTTEDVVLLQNQAHQSVILPRSMSRLSPEQFAVTRDIQRTVMAISKAQGDLSDLVLTARSSGVSWVAIGWCVGTTADAARRRWTDDEVEAER